MREHPILFSAEMVRAILDGRKTQTRRVVTPQPSGKVFQAREEWDWQFYFRDGYYADEEHDIGRYVTCPYGKAGDRLWVRETFVIESNFNLDAEDKYPPPFNDGRPVKRVDCEEYGKYWQQCHYRATDPIPMLVNTNTDEECKWRPSIYMPRWASRITLEIVNVRVERLQDISEENIWSEGVEWRGNGDHDAIANAYDDFQKLWDSINAKRGYGWDKNPFVWVIEFKRV